jgi:hypothetical protein
MKTFIETVREEEKPEAPIGIPTFSEAISQKEETEEVKEGFTGKDAVSKSFELLHGLQLELQKTEKDLLTMRDEYLSYEKGSEDRKKIEPKMLDLGKKKKDLEKKIQDADIASQRAIANDDTEFEDLDIF